MQKSNAVLIITSLRWSHIFVNQLHYIYLNRQQYLLLLVFSKFFWKMNTLRFIPSGRGGRKALYMGFVYTKQRSLSSGSSWHCVCRHENCKGRVQIDSNEETIEIVKTHNHIPDFGQAKALQLLKVDLRISIYFSGSFHSYYCEFVFVSFI